MNSRPPCNPRSGGVPAPVPGTPGIDRRAVLKGVLATSVAGTGTIRLGASTGGVQTSGEPPQPLPSPVPGTPIAQGQSLADATTPDLVATIHAALDEDQAVDALIEAFGRAGVAVYPDDPLALEPLLPIEGVVNPLMFQRWQVAAMTREIRREGGTLGAAFDEMVPPETIATVPDAPLPSQLVAAWCLVSTAPGAAIGRTMMGEIDLETAAARVYPTAVTALFAADVLQACVSDTAPASLRGRRLSFAPAASNRAETACGYANQFLTNAFAAVKAAVEAGAASVGLPKFLIDILGFILNTVAAAVEAILAPVLAIVRAIGAMLAVGSYLVSSLTPWTLTLTPDPAVNKFGLDGAGVYGKLTLSVDGLDLPTWPTVVVDCAKLANITLPKDSAAGSDVVYKISEQPRPLAIWTTTTGELDAQGTALWDYVTETEPAAWAASGAERIGVLGITATVRREDLIAIRDKLVEAIFSALGPFVRDVIVGLIGGLPTVLSQQLIDMATVSTYRSVPVIYHDEPVEPTAEPTTETETGGCWIGTWNVTNLDATLLSLMPTGGGIDVVEIFGLLTMFFSRDGEVTVSYIGLSMTIDTGQGIYVRLDADGSASGTYTVEDNVFSMIFDPTSLTLTMTVSLGDGSSTQIPPEELMQFFSSGWETMELLSCGGDSMTMRGPTGILYEMARFD